MDFLLADATGSGNSTQEIEFQKNSGRRVNFAVGQASGIHKKRWRTRKNEIDLKDRLRDLYFLVKWVLAEVGER
ncbi:MAG TPA: hypothetical protein PLL14_03870 [Accumulibacter sp.]|nr:hypothetical protein [Accumulibacter sp.]